MKEYIEREGVRHKIRTWIKRAEEKEEYAAAECFEDCLYLLNDTSAADPIREMGGCYCWECEEEDKGHCRKLRGIPTIQIGFCGYGRRKEEA